MSKKLVSFVLAVAMLLCFCAAPALAADPVTLKIVVSQPEYMAQEQEIWALYTEANPHVTIELMSINEDTEAAFNTQVAAGKAPDLQLYCTVDKENYQIYQNLADLFTGWDLLSYDGINLYSSTYATEPGFAPCIYPFGGTTFSFIYHADLVEAAGLDPKTNVIKTWDDLEAFLAALKVYADANGYACTLDLGWHSWCIMSQTLDDLAVSLGSSQAELRGLWIDRTIAWNDIENNPYAAAFAKLKEWYDAGYLPEKWWTRAWETDYEAGFASKSSILAYHGPWLWTKVETVDPDVELSGFCFPANDQGLIQNGSIDAAKGTVLFQCNADGANQAEAVAAMNWWLSPEVVKMRAEAFGSVPMMDLSSVGSAELASSQYNEVVKPVMEGVYGDVKFDSAKWARDAAGAYKIKGGQDVTASDEMVPFYGDYFEGKISLQELLDVCQTRFETYYSFE